MSANTFDENNGKTGGGGGMIEQHSNPYVRMESGSTTINELKLS